MPSTLVENIGNTQVLHSGWDRNNLFIFTFIFKIKIENFELFSLICMYKYIVAEPSGIWRDLGRGNTEAETAVEFGARGLEITAPCGKY